MEIGIEGRLGLDRHCVEEETGFGSEEMEKTDDSGKVNEGKESVGGAVAGNPLGGLVYGKMDWTTGASGEAGDRRGSTDEATDGSSTPSVDDAFSLASDNDRDSAVAGMSVLSSTMSVRSSIYEHVEENGHTYHRYKQGKYPLPNDENEQERLDLQHALMNLTLHGKLYLAPIGEPKEVLDIATGTGIWAVDFANQHPNANVLGTDLSAIQPLYVPPNCRFEIDDCEDEWVFSTKFDYIHGRALVTCFEDPSYVIRQAFNSLAPGGYLELQDGIFPMAYVGEPPTDCALYKWNEFIVQGGKNSGRPWTNVPFYKKWMQEIGFEDVVEKHFYWPTSPWPKGKHLKQVALFFQQDMLSGLEGISMKIFTNHLGWTAAEVHDFCADVRNDFKDCNVHAYLPIRIVYGRKPQESEAK